MSVDLPAPFSPSRQRTSPGMAVRLMWSLATTPGKALVMSMSSTAGVLPPAVELGARARRSVTTCRASTGVASNHGRDLDQQPMSASTSSSVGVSGHGDRAIGDAGPGRLDGGARFVADVRRVQQPDAAVGGVQVRRPSSPYVPAARSATRLA